MDLLSGDKPICYVSSGAYEVFDDEAFMNLLRQRGVDLRRPIRFGKQYPGLEWVAVYYDDTFIGAGI
jgi:hypothetical protein